VTIRLLDPPLHEFLPKRSERDSESFTYEQELLHLATALGVNLDVCLVFMNIKTSIFLRLLTFGIAFSESHKRVEREQSYAGLQRLQTVDCVPRDHGDAEQGHLWYATVIEDVAIPLLYAASMLRRRDGLHEGGHCGEASNHAASHL